MQDEQKMTDKTTASQMMAFFRLEKITEIHGNTRGNVYYIDTRTYTHISSSCRTASTDFPNPFSPPISIVHCSREVFKAISCIDTELLYICSSWWSNFCSSMWKGSPEYIAYEFFLTSPALSHMSGLSNLDSFRDEWLVVVRLLFCGVLPPGFVQDCSNHSYVIAVTFS